VAKPATRQPAGSNEPYTLLVTRIDEWPSRRLTASMCTGLDHQPRRGVPEPAEKTFGVPGTGVHTSRGTSRSRGLTFSTSRGQPRPEPARCPQTQLTRAAHVRVRGGGARTGTADFYVANVPGMRSDRRQSATVQVHCYDS
jgi:hypothetical protein